ncbi:MAG: sporulation integral membrane protein YlbJ [Syntrophomonadaceae bacterium]
MSILGRVLFLLLVLILTLFMLINPRETIDATITGIKLWASVLLPALLPFFISAELMISSGLAVFVGVLLEPIMRPLFRLPGCCSLVVVMGFTSGFPVGAIMTRRLYEEKMIGADQAERLVSFTNNSSPLFIIGAVGVGMLSSPLLGYILALAHYLSNLLIGLLWRFRASSDTALKSPEGIWKRAWTSLKSYPSPGPGKMLGNAIKNSLNNILAIAGFVVFFSLLTRMLSVTGIMEGLAQTLSRLLHGLDYNMAYALLTGFFEITLGTKCAATGIEGKILPQLLIISVILAFSGCSIIAQVMSTVAGIPVRLSFYLLSRLVQIGFSVLFTWLAYHYLASTQVLFTASAPFNKLLYSFDAWSLAFYSLAGGLTVLTLTAVLSLFFTLKNHPS